jgi:tRNA A37 threonylcarbamoyladenosine synthetase subunit TsaC/SUA5/YrdC
VAAGAASGDPGAAFPDELAECLAVVLDAGVLPDGPASAVIDCTGPAPVLRRSGPWPLDVLLEACPSLVVPPA